MTPTLEISRTRFLQNLAAVHERIGPAQLMLAMKDDAYGHGVEWAASVAKDAARPVEMFGGYDVHTSLRIRAQAERATVFAWADSSDDEIERALHARIQLGVGSADYLRRVIDVAGRLGLTARVHLKIDTGLHRNGIRPEDWPRVVADAMTAQQSGLIEVVGVWSHLAEASDAEDDESARAFHDAVDVVRAMGGAPQALHLTASAASWWRPELRGTVCRIGAFCYGIRSADGPEIPGVTPIAALRARVIEERAGEVVIGLGAYHGLPSILAGASIGTPGGVREIVRIDATSTLVRDWNDARVGDTVTVFGPGDQGESDVTALAERIDTVGEEIITRLTSGVRRVIVD
ncbi:alanine racemase [Microbacterium murale]|uniref:Alanine racemase n=1 Tax=Microbacterium murale TaxID=1081040 RepID=A0ABQ1RS65_9MICO|nr:alanine racemase [Microbacterium murale]GGD77753.1 alanine racemase [Microbacterium murale]